MAMRRRLIAGCVLFLLICALSLRFLLSPILVNPSEVNLGKLEVGDVRHVLIGVRNCTFTRNAQLDVRASCGCVITEVPQGRVLPFERIDFRAAVSALGIFGSQQKDIFVSLVGIPDASVTVPIKFEVIENLRVFPATVTLRPTKPSSASFPLVVEALDSREYVLVGIYADNEQIQVSSPQSRPMTFGGGANLQVEFNVNRPLIPYPVVNSKIRLRFERVMDKKTFTLTVPVRVEFPPCTNERKASSQPTQSVS